MAIWSTTRQRRNGVHRYARCRALSGRSRPRGWRITQIWNTHWHPDHAGGNRDQGGDRLHHHGPGGRCRQDRGVDRTVDRSGDTVHLGDHVRVLAVGGHTLGHIAYRPAGRCRTLAFVGDALFALGCGRMFEGTPDQFWTSLLRLKALPRPPADLLRA
jgi:hydroxyacylglutathione hydrolase